MHPRHHAALHPDRPALVLADTGACISYRELVDNSDRAAQLFAALGLVEGDTIALFLENHIRYAELCWAAKNSGITYACISSQATVEEASYIVDNCDARLLISSAALAGVALEVARPRAPTLRCLMLDAASAPFESYETRLADMPAQPLSGRRRGPSMLYSSGTTGKPKGVRTPLLDEPPETPPRRLAMLRQHYGLDADTVLVCPGPFYHAAPGRFTMSVQRCGGTMIGFAKFDAEAALAAVEKHRATHGLFVPTMFIRMLKLDADVRAHYRHDSLRCVLHLAAPCPVPVKQQMIDWWGPVIEEIYGGTEAVGHTLINSRQWLAHQGSVGLPAAGCSIRIVDEAGLELPPFVPGLIQMRNGHRFEYYKDAEKTRSALREDGWGTLGDIGYLDAEGYLYLTDRQSHMIVSGGVNIYPQEVESLLYSHADIADVAVIGVPHEEFGEAVKAVVQPKVYPVADAERLALDILRYCRERLSPIKCPRSVDFVESLPRNESGKLLKRLVKAPYWAGRANQLI
ncbi:MAG: AMP-binding protein [Pseudomonadota bacterium]